MFKSNESGTALLDRFLKSGYFKYFAALTAFFIFKPIIDGLIQDFLIDQIFSKIRKSPELDIAILLSIFMSYLVFASRLNKNYQVSENKLTIILVLTTIYSYYRQQYLSKWCFQDFTFMNGLHYFDIIYLICGSYFILYGYNRTKEERNQEKDEGFELDLPIGSPILDLYGRKQFAEEIARKISFNYNEKKSIAVSIDGPWGSGKTSFINMIKNFIKQNDKYDEWIVIDFHPWKSTSPQQIISDFFDTLTSHIKEYNGTLSNKLEAYADTLTRIDENNFIRTLELIARVFKTEKNKDEQYNDINEALDRINKRIIFFIDDIDRLDKKEIIEVIRLVRNTASFNNTTFVVTYEREYIINAIRELNEHKHIQYLEKIFQFEFTLPSFEKLIIKNRFLELLLPSLNEEHKVKIYDVVFPVKGIIFEVDVFDRFIKTNRDVVRYVNSFLFDYHFIKDEVEIIDFSILQLLKLKYPDVYDLLYEKRDNFLSMEKSMRIQGAYQYSLTQLQNVNTDGDKKVITYVISTYLKDNYHSIQYTEPEIKDIIQILLRLFNSNAVGYNQSHINEKSISICDNFYKYFANRVFAGEISIQSFNSAFSLQFEHFRQKIEEWHKRGFENDLLIRLTRKRISDTKGKGEFEKLIRAIFYFGHLSTVSGTKYLYDTRQLYNMLNHSAESDLIKNAYGGDYLGFGKFVNELLSGANSPYAFESRFIRDIYEWNQGYFVLDRNTLSDIQLSFVEKYLVELTEFDGNLWTLIYDTKRTMAEEDGLNNSQLESQHTIRLTVMITDFIEKHQLLDDFLKSLIRINPREGHLIGLSLDPINAIFGNMLFFEQYLALETNSNKSIYLKEFIKFYSECKNSGYKYINYKF